MESRPFYPLFYASIGVVESEDYGKTVSYRSKAPVLDKSEFDPSSVTGPWVLYDRDIYRMWYVLVLIGYEIRRIN